MPLPFGSIGTQVLADGGHSLLWEQIW